MTFCSSTLSAALSGDLSLPSQLSRPTSPYSIGFTSATQRGSYSGQEGRPKNHNAEERSVHGYKRRPARLTLPWRIDALPFAHPHQHPAPGPHDARQPACPCSSAAGRLPGHGAACSSPSDSNSSPSSSSFTSSPPPAPTSISPFPTMQARSPIARRHAVSRFPRTVPETAPVRGMSQLLITVCSCLDPELAWIAGESSPRIHLLAANLLLRPELTMRAED